MTGKKKAALAVVVAAVLSAVAFLVGSGSAVSANGGTYTVTSTQTQQLEDGASVVDTTLTNGPVVKLRFGLVAAGTNTKTYVQNGIGCGNVSMVWDDSPPGASYLVSKFSTWNAVGTCGGAVDELQDVDKIDNNGVNTHHGALGDTQTWANYEITTGASSTKGEWSYRSVNGSFHVACGVMIPGGGGLWYKDVACN